MIVKSKDIRNGTTILRATGARYESVRRTSKTGNRFVGKLVSFKNGRAADEASMALYVGTEISFCVPAREQVEMVLP